VEVPNITVVPPVNISLSYNESSSISTIKHVNYNNGDFVQYLITASSPCTFSTEKFQFFLFHLNHVFFLFAALLQVL
jgi:hypothetical protein